MSFPSSRSAGFGLVEALGTLVIVGLISLMLVEGLGTGTRVWRMIDRRLASQEALESAWATLRDRLEEIYPATLLNKNPPYADFTGKSDKMEFISNPPSAKRPGPLRRYGLFLNAAGDLILTSVSDVAPQFDQVTNQIILSDVRQISVTYFGSTATDQTRRWRSFWEDQLRPHLTRSASGWRSNRMAACPGRTSSFTPG